ncbi:MAG: hypothetical protein A3F70_08745 [Acidobacteria bacterium RIFCSPLOWO2_12_FULL_67_14]|nr:MAG: hypothetical protein A3F70_08745 [Acidobacteria bacterium RIFCSPLOWO2_12_FULL_67_14]
MQIVTIDGRPVRYVESGDPGGAPLVLVHAFPVGVGMFDPQRGAFPGRRIIAPALPGFDGSAPLAAPSVDAYARHVIGLLDALRIDRAVLGGVSLGGYVLFGVLRQAAARVAGIMLADTRSAADTGEARAGRIRMLGVLRDKGVPAVAADMLPKLLGETSRRRQPGLAQSVTRMIEGQTAEGIAAAIEVLMSRPDSTPLLRRLAVPALVVVGAEDGLTTPGEMERMASQVPGAQFVSVPGAGHLSNLENPPAFNQAVAQWLGLLHWT